MQQITIPVPEGKKAVQTTDKDGNIIIKWVDVEPIRSKSWEEYCKNHPFKEGHSEYYLYGNDIEVTVPVNANRIMSHHSGHMETKEDAKAILALIRLKRLRDEWRDGWKPEWNNPSQVKYCIILKRNVISACILYGTNTFLSFPSESMADDFKKYHSNLIELAKPFLQ